MSHNSQSSFDGDTVINSTPSSSIIMNLTPSTSPSLPIEDELGIYSDSDVASQNSLNLLRSGMDSSILKPPLPIGGSAGASASSSPSLSPTISNLSSLKTPGRSRSTSRRDSSESTPSPMPKRRIRRKSNKSDGSEKSQKSAPIRHLAVNSASINGELYPHSGAGAGYTLMPATGKIFRNLLILEDSLREQVIQQRALRRKYLTFLSTICSIIASISYHLYFVEYSLSSSGATRVVLQFILLALLVTLVLYHLSGEYQKTIVAPKKFLSSTNKGLRQFNVRLIKIKSSMTDNITDLIRELLLFVVMGCLSSLHKVYPSMKNNQNSKLEVFLISCKLQCQPRIGVTDVKLMLSARVFSTDVREGWELYRTEFWIQEGVRRRQAMIDFADGKKTIPTQSPLERSKLILKDRKERRGKRRKSVNSSSWQLPNKLTLSELNLRKLNNSDDDALSPPGSLPLSPELSPEPHLPSAITEELTIS